MNNKIQVLAEPNKQEIITTREFEASRELVFKAYTSPELYKQWIGGGFSKEVLIEKFEAVNGGTYRWIPIKHDGTEDFAFKGVYHEVLAPERIINTFEWEGLPETGHVILEFLKFEELPNNRTKVTAHSVFPSVADRDGMVASGMEMGMSQSYEKLDELLLKGV